ncbi:MAG: polysaccharide deacetylase family protein [Saprospiraceae bacterium]
MYLVKSPRLLQALAPSLLWHVETQEKVLYLTFDDGPIPDVTPFVLGELRRFGARATFFCVGDNVQKHPDIFAQILAEGHTVGNHTFNHLNGWKTPLEPYLENVAACAQLVDSQLFRPPYGRLRRAQRKALEGQYRIVMWDVLSGDFDLNIAGEQCLENVLQNALPGSIIVMHDSLKAEPRLRFALPRVLEHFSEAGYVFEELKRGKVEELKN